MKTSTYSRRSNTVSTVRSRRRLSWRHAGAGTTANPAARAPAPVGHLPLSGCCARALPRRRCRASATRRRSAHSPNSSSHAPAAGRARAPRRRSATGPDADERMSSGSRPVADTSAKRFRPDAEGVPRAERQHPTQRSKQEPVARLEARPASMPAQDRQLVTQHKDLQLLRALTAPEQHNSAQTADTQRRTPTTIPTTTSKGRAADATAT